MHESLLTPSMRKSPSTSSFTSTKGSTSSVPTTTPTLTIDSSKSLPARPSEYSPLPMVKAANAALMERSHFAIDDATGDDDDTDDESERGADDDQVLDEVCYLFCFDIW